MQWVTKEEFPNIDLANNFCELLQGIWDEDLNEFQYVIEDTSINKTNPIKYGGISWIIMGIGILVALIGAFIAQNYHINVGVAIGGGVLGIGIVYYFAMVRCPYCGHLIAGYRPFPKECPNCNKRF